MARKRPEEVGESPSSSQHATVRQKRVNRESGESGRMCLFVAGDQQQNKNLPQFRPITDRNNTTALERLPKF